ncbi:MAG TPA: outer membrane protein assembly factor BamD [Chthoniobacterales bacterium]|jgi:outer membrane protein assembly factor BamD
MDLPFRSLCLLLAATLVLPQLAGGAVVFKAGEGARYVAPGEEEMSGNAEELFHKGQLAEKDGNLSRAVRAYKTLVKRHPKDALAPGALFHAAELQERQQRYLAAAETFRTVVERYPSSAHFDDAIEAQFRIGELYLAGKKLKFLGISVGNALDKAVEIFAAVVRTAPYGQYTARAQFDIGMAREKQGLNDAALQAYQAVIDKFPNEPVAANAQYQIGYIWFMAARSGTKDVAATKNAQTAFQDFLYHYPHSEKGAQARANLELLGHKETTSSFQVAKFYDKQKNYRAAVIYYNEVIRQQPGSSESEHAKKRIDQLRDKFGDEVLQPVPSSEQQTAQKKPAAPEKKSGTAQAEPAGASSAKSKSPLPPPEADAALPPPASLLPDNTTAPASLFGSEPSATPTPSPAADSPVSPESSPAPTP